MKNLNKKFWGIIAIIIGCMFLCACLFFNKVHHIRYFFDLIFWPIMFLYIFLTSYWLYKLEWKNVLGLFKGNITKKIMKQSLWRGLLLAAILNIITIVILVTFNQPILFPFNSETSYFEILFGAVIIAPIAEEIMFRGFIQGILQKNHTLNENKTRIKIVIIITSFLFAIAHVRYIIYTETMEWVLALSGIFITSLYLGYLRSKHQSVIPSMFAHFGFNISWIVAGPVLALMLIIFQPVGLGQTTYEMKKREYKNDSVYNFDPNDWGILYEAQHKFLAFHNPPHPEFKPYIVKGRTVIVDVFYDIDSCGMVYNVHVDSMCSGIGLQYTSKEIEKEAIRLVELFPQHKPFVKDSTSTRSSWFCQALVPIYY